MQEDESDDDVIPNAQRQSVVPSQPSRPSQLAGVVALPGVVEEVGLTRHHHNSTAYRIVGSNIIVTHDIHPITCLEKSIVNTFLLPCELMFFFVFTCFDNAALFPHLILNFTFVSLYGFKIFLSLSLEISYSTPGA